MRCIPAALCLLAAACGADPPDPPAGPKERRAEPPAARPAPAAPALPTAPRRSADAGPAMGAKDAAAVLRLYYDHVEAGRYREAWAMRSTKDDGYDRFERSFAAYRTYKVTLGPPTIPVEAGGWAYVEVPIQIFGTLKTGAGFGTVGSVTMRRAVRVPDAAPRERAWHIHIG